MAQCPTGKIGLMPQTRPLRPYLRQDGYPGMNSWTARSANTSWRMCW